VLFVNRIERYFCKNEKLIPTKNSY
jgi:hypothetical protein